MRSGSAARISLAVLTATALLHLGIAQGQAPQSPLPLPPPVETESEISALAAFLRDNPGCRELTDACQVCVRDAGRIACTTPGIACIKQAWRCTASDAETPLPPPK